MTTPKRRYLGRLKLISDGSELSVVVMPIRTDDASKGCCELVVRVQRIRPLVSTVTKLEHNRPRTNEATRGHSRHMLECSLPQGRSEAEGPEHWPIETSVWGQCIRRPTWQFRETGGVRLD